MGSLASSFGGAPPAPDPRAMALFHAAQRRSPENQPPWPIFYEGPQDFSAVREVYQTCEKGIVFVVCREDVRAQALARINGELQVVVIVNTVSAVEGLVEQLQTQGSGVTPHLFLLEKSMGTPREIRPRVYHPLDQIVRRMTLGADPA